MGRNRYCIECGKKTDEYEQLLEDYFYGGFADFVTWGKFKRHEPLLPVVIFKKMERLESEMQELIAEMGAWINSNKENENE